MFLIATAALVALSFATRGGVDETVASPGNTWAEIALVLFGVSAVTVRLLSGHPAERSHGLVSAGLMALLFALGAVSIVWSVAPDSSWLASGQMLAYLGAFAGSVALAQLVPNRWAVLLGAITASTVALCLWSLIVKVFPATLAPGNVYARLSAPFGYWNAIALSAAMGLAGCLWVGARRDAGRRFAAVSVPALSIVLSVLALSYSRSADFAAVIVGVVWLTFTPLRLRAVATLLVGAVGAAVISAWALSHHDLNTDFLAPAVQDHAGHTFGIVILVVLAAMGIAGVVVTGWVDSLTLTPERRRRIGVGLLGLVGLAVIVAIAGLALSSQGLAGHLTHAWHTLTSSQGTGDTAGRVLGLGSSRPVYWREALSVGDHAVFKGSGLLGFSVARLRYATNPEPVQQAHSYIFETYADLGVIGLVVSAALLGSWLLASARTIGLRQGSITSAQDAERNGLVTLVAIVVGFGVQSTLDWTWFFTGLSVPALLSAGWLAGCGPLASRARAPRSLRQSSPLDRPLAVVAVPLLLAAAVLGSWMIWRPLHSAELVTSAENASGTPQALVDARAARSADPLALLPYILLSSLNFNGHHPAQARADLIRATRAQPQNPSTWAALATFDVQQHAWREAIPALRQVQILDRTPDPMSEINKQQIAEVLQHYKSPRV